MEGGEPVTGIALAAIAPEGSPEPPRDRWERYVVTNATGENDAYRRVTSVVKKLGNTFGLEQWQQRQVANGMGMDPSLVLLAMAHPDPAMSKSIYTDIVEGAMEVSGSNTGRRLGSALHGLTEQLDLGTLDLDKVRATDEAFGHRNLERLVLYRQILQAAGITLLLGHVEQVLLLDRLAVAGTADRFGILGRWTPKPLKAVLDLKTGSIGHGANEWAAQLAAYACHDATWNHVAGDTWERGPAIPDVDRETGIVVHLPAVGEPVAALYQLDLELGFTGLNLAVAVMDYQNEKVMTPYEPGLEVEAVAPGDAYAWLAAEMGATPPEQVDRGPAEPVTDLAQATYDWLVQRMSAVAEAGAVGELVHLWPATVPQPLPKPPAPLAGYQVHDLVTVLERIEREHELPFTLPRPGSPPPKRTPRKAPPKAAPRKRNTPTNKES